MFAVLWAVFCGATALQVAGAAWLLLVVRSVPRKPHDSGGSESQLRMVPGERAFHAVGYFNVGSSIGAMIAPPLVYGQS